LKSKGGGGLRGGIGTGEENLERRRSRIKSSQGVVCLLYRGDEKINVNRRSYPFEKGPKTSYRSKTLKGRRDARRACRMREKRWLGRIISQVTVKTSKRGRGGGRCALGEYIGIERKTFGPCRKNISSQNADPEIWRIA